MKRFLKSWFINAIVMVIIAWVYNGITISFSPYDFVLATLILTIIIKVVKPLFELIFLPINILTLGVFRWLRTVISLGILNYLLATVTVQRFFFPGFDWGAMEIKSFTVSAFLSLIITALLFNLVTKIVRWLISTN
ncbi:MAG TPA: phage holin family protein [Candidatus Bathyarchaeia archaeon]|nr:phage holin family protein [Candidatus Bathyarchaeia archaeon]